MRTSPWLGLAITLPLLLLAAWAIIRFTGPGPDPAALRSDTSLRQPEPTTGEEYTSARLEIQASPGLTSFSLEHPISGWQTSLESGFTPLEGKISLHLPPGQDLELLLGAKWENASPGPAALTLSLTIPGRTLPAQTFWTEVDEQGNATLEDMIEWNLE